MTLLHSDGTGDATTTMCHRYTPPEQLPVMTKTADIVIVATGMCVKSYPGYFLISLMAYIVILLVGVTHLIKADMIKEGAAVIDVGESWRLILKVTHNHANNFC